MKQFLLAVCMLLCGTYCSAQNARTIEDKMTEFGRVMSSKQNVYYTIGEDGKVTDVKMSCTIDEELQAEIKEFFMQLPPFSGGAGTGMVSIVPSESVQKTQGTVAEAVSGEKAVNDSTSNRVLATQEAVKKQKEIKIGEEPGQPQIYDDAYKKPYVIGGKARWGQFLADNLQYPAQAKEYGAQGRVLVTFVVERDGTTSHATPVKSNDPYLEEEACRLIQNMPKWMPASLQDGRVVRMRYTLAIPFRL